MKIARIEDDRVVEIDEREDVSFLEEGWHLCTRQPIEIGWTFVHGVYEAPVVPRVAEDDTQEAKVKNVVTRFAFLSRFTPAERTHFLPPVSDPIIADALFLFDRMDEIDLASDQVKTFMDHLVAEGHLTADRLAAILQ